MSSVSENLYIYIYIYICNVLRFQRINENYSKCVLLGEGGILVIAMERLVSLPESNLWVSW